MTGRACVSDVFEQHWKALALDEFPTGHGDWRNNLKWRSDLLEQHGKEGAHLYTEESLMALSKMVPFDKNLEWSDSVGLLQEKKVKTKNVEIKPSQNLYKFFKNLRFVDKNINIIDENVCQFSNLENLTLSANYIEFVDLKNIPKSLKVLELCGNKLSDVCCLTTQPINLQYLGLSYNHIAAIPQNLNPQYWSFILALDVSFNNLSNLKNTVKLLSQLQRLRSLLLQGNPVFFGLCYRGYVIDSMKQLTVLDDIQISENEKYNYNGYSQLVGDTVDIVSIIIKMENLKGMVNTDEESEDFPRTVKKYHLEFDFFGDCEFMDLSHTGSIDTETRKEFREEKERSNEIKGMTTIKSIEIHPTNTDEQIPLNFAKTVTTTKTILFHEYCKNNMKIRLMENAIVIHNEPKLDMGQVNPNIDPSVKEKSQKPVHKGRNGAKASVVTKDDKSKGGGIKNNKNKKDGIFELSRTEKLIASCQVDLQELMEGSTVVETECIFEENILLRTVKDDIPAITIDDGGENLIVVTSSTDAKKKLRGKDPSHRSVSSIRAVSSAKSSFRTHAKKLDSTPETAMSVPVQDVVPTKSVSFFMELLRSKTKDDFIEWQCKNTNKV